MNIRSRTVKLGAAAAIGIAAVTAGTAYAYPPGQHLAVAAVRGPAVKHKIVIVVSISNAQPGCPIAVLLNKQQVGTVTAAGDGTATFTINGDPVNGGGRQGVVVRTTKPCAKERARAGVDVEPAHLEGPATVKLGKPFAIHAEDWPPNLPVTCTATSSFNHSTVTVSGVTGPHGAANFRFAHGLSAPYAWGIVCVGQGGVEMHTWWVQVKKK